MLSVVHTTKSARALLFVLVVISIWYNWIFNKFLLWSWVGSASSSYELFSDYFYVVLKTVCKSHFSKNYSVPHIYYLHYIWNCGLSAEQKREILAMHAQLFIIIDEHFSLQTKLYSPTQTQRTKNRFCYNCEKFGSNREWVFSFICSVWKRSSSE
jgi:hypothetical protein